MTSSWFCVLCLSNNGQFYSYPSGFHTIEPVPVMSPDGYTHAYIPLIAIFMGPTWGPPGSCRPQMGPMLAPWTLVSGTSHQPTKYYNVTITKQNTTKPFAYFMECTYFPKLYSDSCLHVGLVVLKEFGNPYLCICYAKIIPKWTHFFYISVYWATFF